MSDRLLVIACGALAQEITALKARYGWEHLDLKCIDAKLHNHPAKIPARLREKIRLNKANYADIFVAYADCGTGGEIDKIIEEEGIKRLPGAHCYQFFAGEARFTEIADEEPGTFYLTDFLAQHFDQFVTKPLKLVEHPELRDAYFGNYRRVVYLSQTDNEDLMLAAKKAAKKLGLAFEHVSCGYGELKTSLQTVALQRDIGLSNKRTLHDHVAATEK
ncbi:MAG: DUF1638 domain-containing protein [Woeseia sp.]|nr:DUF1638 domain-containing protein [Woeseia sp.]